jgi:hypothetical protein
LEGKGVVSDDASNWTVAVSHQYHYKVFYEDSSNNSHPFSCSASNPNDGPRPDYLQQPTGQKSIFYIDGPGPYHGINPSNGCQLGSSLVDSETTVFEFPSYVHEQGKPIQCDTTLLRKNRGRSQGQIGYNELERWLRQYLT